MNNRKISSYEVPANLKFSTHNIIAMRGLECYVKLNPADFQKILRKGKILNLSLKLEFITNTQDIILHAKLKGEKQMQCTRCLSDFTADIDIDIDNIFPVKEQIIDIMKEVVSELALCSEIAEICKPSCKGLCQMCGTDLNISKCKCKKMPHPAFMVLKDKLRNLKYKRKNL